MYRSPGNVAYGPYSGGELTDPADESTVAETPTVLPPGSYECIVTCGASAAADFRLEQRNAADAGLATGTNSVVIKAPVGQSGQYRFLFNLKVGERIRLYMDDALTGKASAALNLEQFG